jgi:hypothetical protein
MAQNDFYIFHQEIANNISMASSFTSDPYDINRVKGLTVQFFWENGSSPVGTMDIFASNLQNEASSYQSILSSPVNLSGNMGNQLFNISEPYYKYVKIVYTRTSGSGQLSVVLNGKGV